ncbi:hypothetical protein V6N11_044471 [Hibiscus sabdariffa]|uniref:Uncharacterized protein n=1 Tax=Hibiscus sabdariffa TaxID=183260 RepID=A0ABR2RF95_9ROSI
MDRERKESKTTTKMEGKDRMENRDNARCETVSGESKEEDRKGEFNWKDSDVCKRIKGTTMKEERRTECKVKVDSCESSSSSSESQHDKAAEPESESHRGKEEDELNAVVLGNLNNHDNSCDIVELNSRLEESEMKGINAKNNKINQHILSREEDITASIQRFDGVESKVFVADNWQKVESVKSKVTKRIVEEKRELSPVGVSQRAWDDLCDMGLGLQMKSTGKNKDKGISSRATAVENKENVGLILGEMRKSLLRKGLVSRFFFFITKAIALVRAKASKEDSFEHIEFWWERSLIFFIVEDKYCVEGSSQWKDSARSYLVAWVLGGAMGCGGFLRTNEVQCSGLDFVELLVLKMVADCL